MVIGLKPWRYRYGRRNWPTDGVPDPGRGEAILPGTLGSSAAGAVFPVRTFPHGPALRRGYSEQGGCGGIGGRPADSRQMVPPLREGPPRRAVGRTLVDARGPSGMTGWRMSSGGRSIRPRPTPPVGRPARWPGRAAFRRPRSGASGMPSGCSRTVRGPSGSSAIPISRTGSATSWARTCRRRTGRWCFASTKRARIRALDRTQPMLPLRPGIPERRTRDYKRNGTTPPFAAPDIATGFVIGKYCRRHRSEEFPDLPEGRSAPASPRAWTSTSSWTTTPPTRPSTSGHGRR